MNWTRALLAGLAAGVVMTILGFLLHGMILADTYTEHADVFAQEQANPIWFVVISVILSFLVAIAFAKSRACWPAGWKGGATIGVLFGLVVGFTSFYWPLVIDGYPYFLSWCWLGVDVIEYTTVGAVIGAIYRT